MTNNENQYTIYIRSTKESIPVSKEEFDAYYHDINIYRIRQQRHGRCVCPASKRLTCDMDCLTCPFHRMGDMRSLDYTETDDEGNETAWVDEIPDDSPLLEDIIIEASEMKALYARLTELMPEAIKIGELRLEGLSEDAIGERIGIGRKTYLYAQPGTGRPADPRKATRHLPAPALPRNAQRTRRRAFVLRQRHYSVR